ncbi:FG-nucleoporin nsp1 [Elasticomyces elasticus]|nr:FG-nucleoporin nsp1 [Elasticomyces elasticus]
MNTTPAPSSPGGIPGFGMSSTGQENGGEPYSPFALKPGGPPSAKFGGFTLAKQPEQGNTNEASTPAGNKPSQVDFSTTPAGPPPFSGGGLFSKPSASTNDPPQQSATGAPGTTPTSSNPFGSMFGKPAASSTIASNETNASNTSNPPTSASALGGAFSFPKLGGDASKTSQPASADKPTFNLGGASPSSQNPNSETPKSLFGNLQSSTPSSTATGAGLFMLGAKKDDATSSAAPSTQSEAPKFNFPSILGKRDDTQNQSTPQSATNASAGTTSAPSPFSNLGKPASSAVADSATKSPDKSAEKPFSFPNLGAKPAETASSVAEPANTTATSGAATNTAATTNPLGASTSGAAPTPQSRLKSKTLDEILTMWSTSLSTHQKAFATMATQVSTWDRELTTNAQKVADLYQRTFNAEHDVSEVERQLSEVEAQQDELESYIKKYEAEVDQLSEQHGLGGAGGQGVDGERERTYKLAERCHDRLDEMGRDLGSMIEEINAASSKLGSNKKNSAEDPLSQIVRVLNAHLLQLQQIDSGAASLQGRVAAAQKEVRGIGRGAALGNDGVEDFYRSFMGRR